MFKKLLLVFVLLSSSIACAQAVKDPSIAASGSYVLDKTHASLVWKVSHLGLSNYTARFTDFDATLDFNKEDPTKSKLVVTINPMSVETDYPNPQEKDFDKELATAKEWFNAGKFPKITFVSTSIEKTSEREGKVHGDLTFLGVTEPFTLDVTFNGAFAQHPYTKKSALGFSGHTIMKRSDWGFDSNIPFIGDDVEIFVEVEFGQAS